MEVLGKIYRQIMTHYGDKVNVVYLDPRNHLSIAGYLLKQSQSGNIGISGLLKSIFFGIRRMAVFYNGTWVNPDKETDACEILKRIQNLHDKR